MVKNCFRLKSLQLELKSNVSELAMTESLQHLEEIEESLVVVRNRHLISLTFLRSLRLISGKMLYEKKFALFVHSNAALRQLWPLTVRLSNGAAKFFENPELCVEEIERAVGERLPESDVSMNFNGYRRLSCSNRTVALYFELRPGAIRVSWNVSLSDPRRLKGFTLFYAEAQIGENDLEWSYLYVQYDESLSDRPLFATIEVQPYTRYAIYLKTDLTLDSQWHQTRSFIGPLVSDLHFIYSLSSRNYFKFPKCYLKWITKDAKFFIRI